MVERKHQHILNVGRALKHQSSLPLGHWGSGIKHATLLINLSPSPLIQNKTTHEMLYKVQPSDKSFRVFSSLAYACTINRTTTKFDPRGRQCIYLGNSSVTKGYILLDIHKQNIFLFLEMYSL